MERQDTTPRPNVAGVVSGVILVLNVVALAALALGMIYARSRLAEMFTEFGAELPTMTQLLMSVPTWALLLAFAAAAALLVLKENVVRKAPLRLTLNLLAALALLAFTALVVVALFLPLFTLIRQLS